VQDIAVHPKQTADVPLESSLDYLLRQTLASLYEEETEVSFLIHYLQNALSGVRFPEYDLNQQELIRFAEAVLHAGREGKRFSGNALDPAISKKLFQRHVLEKALSEAVRANELSLVFEPIISSSSGNCRALEALLRWTHPERGECRPIEFIPLAERTGDIIAMGRWALYEACREAVTWPGAPAAAVSVNVSPVQIMTGSFPSEVFSALAESGLPPERLQIELTESLFARDHKIINSVLAELRRAGIGVLLDDFGTGFSCLSYLHTAPIDGIKIDKSFIAAINGDSMAILEAIVNIAHALGLEIVAEGVETSIQAETLVSMGVPYLQGFLFTGSSLMPQDARDWLAGEHRPLWSMNT
jgi:EAL domain-containing protein (putative c-di-GMP-specific phosphodiesterase class I)